MRISPRRIIDSRRRRSVQILDLFTDVFLNLADPHPSQSENLTDVLECSGTFVCCYNGAVVRVLMVDPISTAFSLAVDSVFGLNRETRRAFYDFGLSYDVELLLALHANIDE